jgi:imidazoleglycerol-phosphate dehydratase (EC 4.2.1.19)
MARVAASPASFDFGSTGASFDVCATPGDEKRRRGGYPWRPDRTGCPVTAAPRRATVRRETRETQILVEVDLDGSGCARLSSGIAFLDHMLEQISRHGLIDLTVEAQGDLHIDAHHTVEDIGITLGQALDRALGDKGGVVRYGHAYVPLDEALARVVIDLSGRPGLEWFVDFQRARIGDFDVDLFHEFFQGLVNHARMTLHVDALRGRNAHHVAETIFKAFGRALRMACAHDPRAGAAPPSTKGVL